MKLSTALGIVLASSAPCGTTAFLAPSTRSSPRLHIEHSRHSPSSSSISMVGGGMIERPSGDNSSNDDDDDDDDDDDGAPTAAKRGGSGGNTSSDFYLNYTAEKEKFLSKLGRDIDINPWDPNPYIKPRPGKYGWDKQAYETTGGKVRSMQEAQELMSRMTDDEIMAKGNPMTMSEREENLNIIRRLRQNDVPLLRRSGDQLAMVEAAADANAREKADPWYDLNERLGDAIKYDTEDVEHLKVLIDKVGGPPPQLVKYASHPRGYVKRTEIIGMSLSNERLERLIDRRDSMQNIINRENERKEMVKKQMAKLDSPQKEDKELAEIAEIAKRREEAFLRGLMEQRSASDYQEANKEKVKEYEKKREELLKQWGSGGSGSDGGGPDDAEEYMRTKGELVDQTMKEFVTDLKRMSNLYEDFYDDEDDDEDDGNGGGELDRMSEDGSDIGANANKPMSKAALARAEAMKNDGSGRPRLPGDVDVTRGEIDPTLVINESSMATTGPLTVSVSSAYNTENSDPPMRKHCFQYTVRITNNSDTDTVQLLSRRFEIQTVGSSMKDVVQGEGVTGRQPILKPGEVFEYTSTAPLSVRPIGTTEIAARMSGEYRYCTLEAGQEKATEEQVNKGMGEAGAELATFHFVFPEAQRVKPVRPTEEDDDDDDEDDSTAVKTTTVAAATSSTSSPTATPPAAKDATTTTTPTSSSSSPASSLPGEPDMTSGNIGTSTPNDSSDTVTSDVRVVVTSTYRPERSDAKLDKHCFAYNVRITNENKNNQSIQLVSRRFEIQTVGSANKDVVQGPGVTGRQPVLKPGESFEYTSTAPLSVRPMLDKTKVVARMSGEYNFVQLADDGKTPLSSTPLKAELGAFHFILPE
jgi:ApaG protein